MQTVLTPKKIFFSTFHALLRMLSPTARRLRSQFRFRQLHFFYEDFEKFLRYGIWSQFAMKRALKTKNFMGTVHD